MKILVVAMPESIHTARWLNQLDGMGWDVRLFPSTNNGLVHPSIETPVYHGVRAGLRGVLLKKKLQKSKLFLECRVALGLRVLGKVDNYWPRQLQRVLTEFEPDMVHSLEFQSSGYLVARVMDSVKHFPPWLVTNWGSDIYHFRQFPEHEGKIREILENCDYYSCECKRDVCLAQGLGLKGTVLPVIPNAGGFDLEKIERLRQCGPVSKRRTIVLKGYQGWAGRALVCIEALRACADLLDEYEVVIHSATVETRTAAKILQSRTGIKVKLLPKGTPHETILAMYGRARIALGLSLSDGVSTSFLEALAMGAFPIQSWTACADEWVEDGLSGLLVPPEDVTAVASALRNALTNDALVDHAAEINAATTHQRLDQKLIREQAIDYYRTVARERGIACD